MNTEEHLELPSRESIEEIVDAGFADMADRVEAGESVSVTEFARLIRYYRKIWRRRPTEHKVIWADDLDAALEAMGESIEDEEDLSDEDLSDEDLSDEAPSDQELDDENSPDPDLPDPDLTDPDLTDDLFDDAA